MDVGGEVDYGSFKENVTFELILKKETEHGEVEEMFSRYGGNY